MFRRKIAALLLTVALLALAGYPRSASATVLLKTFQFSICVTGEKHPDGCKNSGADAQVVVSDDKMQSLDTKIGQAASIMALSKPGGQPSSRPEGHQHRHLNQGSPGL
jgi:hypothetical protein